MKQIIHKTFWCALVLTLGISLSGCSSLFSISDTVSGLNPFQQQTSAPPPVTVPANEGVPASPAPSIRVEAKPPAPRQRAQQEVEVNVGNNKQCTTFCALPVSKPPAAK